MTKAMTDAPTVTAGAETINESLPDYMRAAMRNEARRVADEVLSPLGQADRKVLVVGGAGYIGSVLCRHLTGAGFQVRCFDLSIYHNNLSILSLATDPDFEYMSGDLCDPTVFSAALNGVTDVVLLAGLVGDTITKKFPDLSRRVNEDGHDTMLSRLSGQGLNKVVFVSTCSNYGLIEGDHLADEDFKLNPLSLYAKSKVRVEKKLLDRGATVDYVPTVLRFATAFGLSPRMRFDLTISEFTRDMYLGNDLLVFDADTWRPYCHVLDFSAVIIRVLEAPREIVEYEVFNAGGSANNYTKKMIVDAILKELPDAQVRYQEHGVDPRNYRVDFTKIRTKLYFEPTMTISAGIAELISALRQGLFHDIERPRSYYGNWQPSVAKDAF